eukprot:m.115150 g.115150  ORF g.115150 m.115150 type:complete len:427 (+) comp13553_c0_seq9:171-1451(+)
MVMVFARPRGCQLYGAGLGIVGVLAFTLILVGGGGPMWGGFDDKQLQPGLRDTPLLHLPQELQARYPSVDAALHDIYLPAKHVDAKSLNPFEFKKALTLPQLMIIGVQKSGTSAMYFSLCLHPQVNCVAYVKEPFFLSLPSTARYLADYSTTANAALRQQFHATYAASCFNISQLADNEVTLEASTTYFESTTAYEAISGHLENSDSVQLMVLLREPVSRAYSHYQHDMRRHGMKEDGVRNPKNPFHSEKFDTFSSAVQEELDILQHCRLVDELHSVHNVPQHEIFDYAAYYECVRRSVDAFQRKHKRKLPGYLLKGLYYGNIQQWLIRFPTRLHVVVYEDFRANPVNVLNPLVRNLNLSPFDYNTVKDEVFHEYQEGSRYNKMAGPLIQSIAEEFATHNDLLAHLLGRQLTWNEQLKQAGYVVPI